MEPHAGGCARALDVPAIGREIEVGLKDLVLRIVRFVAKRVPDLTDFSFEGVGPELQPHAGELHRDRACAHAARAHQRFHAGAHDGTGIDALVVPEKPVLVKERRVDELRVYLRERSLHAIDSVLRGREPQELAFRRVDGRREIDPVKERRCGRALRHLPDDVCAADHNDADDGRGENEGRRAAQKPHGFALALRLRLGLRRLCGCLRFFLGIVSRGFSHQSSPSGAEAVFRVAGVDPSGAAAAAL